ncbi:unnamed protein product [Pieris brassicae]|uniref:Uncharacterized protein n=1 Tax=Pieris brassicae TaxID=7116 RepID=A0A9P0XKT5_PIEBR|nr:unnamed protein product [Pieris brassicae]
MQTKIHLKGTKKPNSRKVSTRVSHVGEANDSKKENIVIETTDEKELEDQKSLSLLIETSRELSTVVSHVGEVIANDSKKENSVIEATDEKELEDQKSLSLLIETSREIEATTKPNILEDEIIRITYFN